MRLKEDSSSYNAQAVKRKNARRSPVENVHIKHRSKKDTNRWCKGKKGREHNWELNFPKNEGILKKFRRMPICNYCGKQDWRKTEYFCKKCGEWHKYSSIFSDCK